MMKTRAEIGLNFHESCGFAGLCDQVCCFVFRTATAPPLLPPITDEGTRDAVGVLYDRYDGSVQQFSSSSARPAGVAASGGGSKKGSKWHPECRS